MIVNLVLRVCYNGGLTKVWRDWSRRKPMLTKEKTPSRLQYLETLYRHGYRSDVVDRSVDKIIALERAAAQRDLADLQQRLQAFEQQYEMSSQSFYQRFRAGELGDEVDFVEWSAFYEMHEAVRDRLDVLSAELG
jgi:hypothetical protein